VTAKSIYVCIKFCVIFNVLLGALFKQNAGQE